MKLGRKTGMGEGAAPGEGDPQQPGTEARQVSAKAKPQPRKSPKRGYLDGQMLIAMPSMGDERFARSVIYVCAHSTEGAMGIVVNQPAANVSFPDLLVQLEVIPTSELIQLRRRARGNRLERRRPDHGNAAPHVSRRGSAVSPRVRRDACGACAAPQLPRIRGRHDRAGAFVSGPGGTLHVIAERKRAEVEQLRCAEAALWAKAE